MSDPYLEKVKKPLSYSEFCEFIKNFLKKKKEEITCKLDGCLENTGGDEKLLRSIRDYREISARTLKCHIVNSNFEGIDTGSSYIFFMRYIAVSESSYPSTITLESFYVNFTYAEYAKYKMLKKDI